MAAALYPTFNLEVAPGAIGSFENSGVVQPQPAHAFSIVMGLSLVLVIVKYVVSS
jgi:hypothetical protein